MLREIIETARTVEEAIDNGVQKLGVDRSDVQFEILELPKKGFLGLMNSPAKVRLYVEIEEPEAPVLPQPERPKAPEAPAQKASAPEVAQLQTQRTAPEAEKPAKAADPSEPVDELQMQKAVVAKEYLEDVFQSMNLHGVHIEMEVTNDSANLTLSGEGLGVIIGRRGETLDSLQYLTSLVINRMGGDYLRITIDSGDYREKRKGTLESLARKMANTAVKTGRSSTLEPMNPYERRIIHAAVSTVRGASSTSVGEEPNRRVVISSASARRPSSGGGGRGPGSGNRGGQRSGGGRPPHSSSRDGERAPKSYTPKTHEPQQNTVERSDTPAEAQGKPLYGKIDL